MKSFDQKSKHQQEIQGKRFANHPSQNVKRECVKMHVELNYGVTAISNRTGANKGLVRKWLIRAGVYRIGGRSKRPICPRKGKRIKKITDWTERQINDLQIKSFIREQWLIRKFENARGKMEWAKSKRQIKDRTKYKTNMGYKLKCRARGRVKNALKYRGLKRPFKSISKVVGCSTNQLAQWLSSMFRDGMTLQNHGTVWEIDHIKPLASFDLSKPEQMVVASHYTNLQPLLKEENRTKGDSVSWVRVQ